MLLSCNLVSSLLLASRLCRVMECIGNYQFLSHAYYRGGGSHAVSATLSVMRCSRIYLYLSSRHSTVIGKRRRRCVLFHHDRVCCRLCIGHWHCPAVDCAILLFALLLGVFIGLVI